MIGQGFIPISLRLLRDTAVDRLRRIEGNTILTNLLLLFAFKFPLDDFIFRIGITLYANLLAYFINDFIDVDIDLAAKNKNFEKAKFLKDNQHIAIILIVLLITVLLIFSLFYSPSVCFAVILVLFTIFIYTIELKKRAYFDVAGCFLWGIALPWIAIPDFSLEGLKLILLLGFFSSSTEILQCLKDYDYDKVCGLKTTAVALGIQKSYIFIRIIYIASAIYTLFVINSYAGLLLLIPFFLNKEQEPSLYWLKLRVIYGITWLLIMLQQFYK